MAGKQAKPAPVKAAAEDDADDDVVVAPSTSAEGVDDDADDDTDDDAPAKPLPEAKVVDKQATARDAFRGIKLGGFVAVLLAGWLFVLVANKFHVTVPVVFACLGYLAILVTVLNLWRTGAAAVSPDEGEAWGRPIGPRGELEKEKKTLLKAIKEAEFDLAMGKLSKADCDSLIRDYRARAILVIKELDRSAGRVLTPKQDIEREIKARIALDVMDKPSKRARNVVEAKDKANAARIARNTAKPVADAKAEEPVAKPDAATETDAAATPAHDEASKPAATGDHA